MSSCTSTKPTPISLRRICPLAAAAALPVTGRCNIRLRPKWRPSLSGPHEIEILNEFYTDMRPEMRSLGRAELFIVDAADGAVKQFTDTEAFVVQRFDRIFFLVPSSNGLEDIVARAVNRGTFMFNHSPFSVTGCTQNVALDQYSARDKLGDVRRVMACQSARWQFQSWVADKSDRSGTCGNVVLHKTTICRHLFAIGGGPEGSAAAGIPVRR